jgi:GNAT superfamily N-acetyltransferase
MNLKIRNIKLKELEEYLESEEYLNSSFVPISRIRAISHINNPRADANDVSLFLAYNDDKLIGYLGAITDMMFVTDIPEKVFWLSCMWVLPEYRRDRIALKLLQHAYNTFKGKVFITNFIPRSKGAFDRTEQYFDLIELEGIRGYSLIDFRTLLVRKYPKLFYLKPILSSIDTMGNLVVNYRLRNIKKKLNYSCNFSDIEVFDNDINTFIESFIDKSLLRRSSKEFNWIKDFPWVKKVEKLSQESDRYYFSQESKDFVQYFLKVEKKNTVVGFLMITIFRGELKIPYIFYKPGFAQDIANYIAFLIIKTRVKVYIGYDQILNKKLYELGVFYHKRKSKYGFIVGKSMQGILKDKVSLLFYGDGDGAFT